MVLLTCVDLHKIALFVTVWNVRSNNWFRDRSTVAMSHSQVTMYREATTDEQSYSESRHYRERPQLLLVLELGQTIS